MGDDGTEILTHYKCFDDNGAGRMPLVVATMLQMRFREIVSLFFFDVHKGATQKNLPERGLRKIDAEDCHRQVYQKRRFRGRDSLIKPNEAKLTSVRGISLGRCVNRGDKFERNLTI